MMVLAKVIRTFNRFRETFGENWRFKLAFSGRWNCAVYQFQESRAAHVILEKRGRYRKVGGPKVGFVLNSMDGHGDTAIEAASVVGEKLQAKLEVCRLLLDRQKRICTNCGGNGSYPEAGTFSRRVRCGVCKGTGVKPIKAKKKVLKDKQTEGWVKVIRKGKRR